jgi:ketosteroid isomerase-like protein
VSHQNVETLRRSNAAFNRRDRDGAFADFHADVEWRDLQHPADFPECIHGRSAVLATWDSWEEVFDEFTAEIEEYIDACDRVLAVAHWRAKGKNSGLEIDLRTVDVYEFADGKIIRATVGYTDKGAALKAVGRAVEGSRAE